MKKSVGACHPATSLDPHLLKPHLGLEGWLSQLSLMTALPSEQEETQGQLAGHDDEQIDTNAKFKLTQMTKLAINSWAKTPSVKL